MGKIDKVKETLNTLRVAMSLLFGLFVVVISNVISRYERAETTLLFWVGVFSSIMILLIIVAIITKIAGKTREIEEL
jgi:uncharacterized phage infection (PIP) family protein YhgE